MFYFLFELTIFIFIAIIIIKFVFPLLVNRWHYRLPPGPFAMPIVGNVKEAIGVQAYKLWAGQLRHQFGDIVLIYAGRQATVIISDYGIAKEALVEKFPKALSGRPQFVAFGALTEGNRDIAGASYGPQWKTLRQIAHGSMRNFMQGDCAVLANMKSFEMVEEELPTDRAINPSPYLYQLALNIMTGLLFDKVYESNDENFIRIRKTLMEISDTLSKIMYVEMLPFLWNLPLPMVKKAKRLFKEYLTILDEEIHHHREMLTSEPRDVTDWLLYNYQQENLSVEDTTFIRQTLSDLLFGGSDTSKHTLHWMVGCLASYPQVQNKVHAEIETYKTTLAPGDYSPSLDWRQHLPYTCATVNEVMRFSSVVPRGVVHTAMSDCKIGQYDVPKGSHVLLNIYGFHNDERYWNEPEKFDPSRFLDDNGHCIMKKNGFAPFSFGPRACLGESIAKVDFFLMTVLLCSKYELIWDDANEDKSIREADNNTFNRLPNEFKIIFRKR